MRKESTWWRSGGLFRQNKQRKFFLQFANDAEFQQLQCILVILHSSCRGFMFYALKKKLPGTKTCPFFPTEGREVGPQSGPGGLGRHRLAAGEPGSTGRGGRHTTRLRSCPHMFPQHTHASVCFQSSVSGAQEINSVPGMGLM